MTTTGQFTLRDLYERFQQIMQLGPLTKVMGMLPGMTEDMFPKEAEADTQTWFKKMLCAMDSMTAQGMSHSFTVRLLTFHAELDSEGKCFYAQPSRVLRIARGSGTRPDEIEALLKAYKHMADMVKKMGGKGGLLSQMMKNGGKNMNPQQMARMGQQMRGNPSMQQMAQMAQQMGLGKDYIR